MKNFVFYLLLTLFMSPIYGQIIINEFQSSNNSTLVDDYGEYPDWIELYNESDAVVNLNNWSVSDDSADLRKWVFPEMELAPNSYLLIYASGRDIKTVSEYWHTVIDMGDDWSYLLPNQEVNSWNSLSFNADSWNTGKSGFGYGDDDDSTIVENGTTCIYLRNTFVIDNPNEVISMLFHVDYDDGFVAYLNGVEVARSNVGTAGQTVAFSDLANENHEAVMYNGGKPEEFNISAFKDLLVEGTNVLAVEGHNLHNSSSDFSVIPFLSISKLSADPYDRTSAYLGLGGKSSHTNFKISSAGEPLFLSSPAGNVVNSIMAIESRVDISYGRNGIGSDNAYFQLPTPGYANHSEYYNLQSDDEVRFSNSGGFINGTETVTLLTNAQGDIYYTNDGSEPTELSTKYLSAISVNSTVTIRARVFNEGSLPGLIYSASFIDGRKPSNLPVVSLTTEEDYLWDETIGMYAKGSGASNDFPYFGSNFWNDWEYPFSFVFMDKAGNYRISQDIGAKIFGGWSRGQDQKSFSLFARKEYGKNSLDYPFFENHNLSSFSSLVLRNSGNDFSRTSIRDGLATNLTKHLGIEHQAFQPVVTYLNGDYWGIYNLREKVNEDFLADRYGLDPDNITILQNQADVVEGSNSEFLSLYNYINNNGSLVDPVKYNYVAERVDIDNFIKYQLSQIYIGNNDWPGNNIKYWKSTEPGSKWRWILYDTDFGFGFMDDYTHNTLAFALATSSWNWANEPWATLMLRRMVTNIGFRNNFINQMADNINTTFEYSRVQGMIDSLTGQIDSEMTYHRERWGMDYDGWIWGVNSIEEYARNRPDMMRDFVQDQFNLDRQRTINLDVSDVNHGSVKINTVVPFKFPFSGVYYQGVPITLEAIPKAGFKFVGWKGDNITTDRKITLDLNQTTNIEAEFEAIAEDEYVLVINEINYNSGEEFNSGDWVELYNPMEATLDISGFVLGELNSDSTFVFPENTILTPGSFIVVAKDLKDFKQTYPYVSNAIGDIPFGFSSNGDEIRLYDSKENVIDAVDYLPYNPWPEDANGNGFTLELRSPGLNNMAAENWYAGNSGGSPGAANLSVVTSVEEGVSIAANKVDIYPTKFSDYVTIQLSLSELNTKVVIEIVDMQGRVVHMYSEDSFNEQFSYDWIPEVSLKGGVYFVRITNQNNIYNSKIIYLK